MHKPLTTFVMVGLMASVAAAQPKRSAPTKAPKAKPAQDVTPLVIELNGTDVEVAAKAAINLGLAEVPAAHDALLDVLAMGVSPGVATEAMSALTLHPAPPDVAMLSRYARHRNPNVRAIAVESLAVYPDPVAQSGILTALHDQAGTVRTAAALAVGRAKIRSAADPMLALLARGEEPAARGLAQLADADLARRIADELGKVPDPSLALCLGLILKRADFGPDPARVEVVRAIGKIQDPAAVTQLSEYVDATPKNPPRPSRQEAEGIVNARLGGGK